MKRQKEGRKKTQCRKQTIPGDLDRSNLNRTEKTIRIDLLQQQQSHHLRGGADGKRSMCCPLCVYKDRHSTGHRLGKPETVATFLYASILIVFFLFSALLLRFIFLFIHSSLARFAVSTRWEREVAENGRVRDFHRFWCCCARRLGNMFVLCERTDGTPLVVAGPCWPFCVCVTTPLILAVSGAVAYFVIISDNSPLVSSVVYE